MYNQMPFSFGLAPSYTSSTSSILSKFNWSSLLSNAQKTLSVVNQAIPLYYQVKPVFNNLRSLTKITKELSSIDNSNNTSNNTQTKENKSNNFNENKSNIDIPLPTFYI